jgi:hypothetical protein
MRRGAARRARDDGAARRLSGLHRTRMVVAILLAALLAGCGSSGGGTASPASSSTTSAPTTSPTARLPASHSNPESSATVAPATGNPTAPAGTPIAAESIDAHQAADLQQEVDNGHQPWRTDVAGVADAFVRGHLGWDDSDVALADPHTAEVTHPADGRMVSLQLRQPVREGAGGIWVVVGGVWLN